MHNAQVYPTNLRRVIIQERYNLVFKRRIDGDLLIYLTLDACPISRFVDSDIEKSLVLLIHVTADSDRPFRYQALFSGFLAANVMQNRVTMRDDGVRNN